MKRKSSLLLALVLMLSLTACGSQGSTPPSSSTPNTPPASSAVESESSDVAEPAGDSPAAAGDGSGILIAYFGVIETDGTDTVANASRVATADGVVGNCQFIAQAIQQAVGGDLFAIETVQEYPGTHQPLLDFAYDELRQNARPELSSIENLEDYSVIFLGYPNWNADLPMPLYTFLETYDLSGKTIIPFVTHGGSGFSRTISTIQALQPNAEVVTDGLSISRNSVPNAAQQAMDWAVEILP